MFLSRFLAPAAVTFIMALRASAETHTLKFVNKCGKGSPVFMYNGKNVLDANGMYTNDGTISGIGYLQTGQCNTNGEDCTLLETTLVNPTCAGCGSSTDISLIAPHEFNVLTSFAYYDGCDGQGKLCDNANCRDVAFFTSTDWFAQVACQVNNVNLLVAFCANASELVLGGGDLSNPGTPSSLSLSSSSTTPAGSPTPSISPNAFDNLSSNTPPSSSSLPPSVSSSPNPGCPAPSPSSPPSSIPTLPPTPSLPPPVSGSSVPPPSSSSPSGDPKGNVNLGSKPSSLPPSGTTRHRRPHSSSLSLSSGSPSPPIGSTPSGSIPAGTPTPAINLSGTPGSCNIDDSNIPQRRRHRRTNRVRY